MRAAVAVLLVAGCQQDLVDLDGIYFSGGRRVHCAVDLDDKGSVGAASIDGGLDRALARNEVIELYAHQPGKTIALATIEHVLSAAQQRGLHFNTYSDFANDTWQAPGVALSFDDTSVFAWDNMLPLLAQYGARATFFVSRYRYLDDLEHAAVADLAAAGHDVEAHSVLHLHAPPYVEQHGLQAYVDNEFQASIDTLRTAGYPIYAYAYPFGARTDELDTALLAHIGVLRSVTFTYEGVESPCPY
jgi:peptidoglycan/xylan/chitin deacetylase (PgdA/CDA1 family)